jgi:RNA polymerase sigma-70 factor (ECF subfamily)
MTIAREATELEAALESHRPELTAYAYRMLGSAFDAEDAVQETLLRAWRGYGSFEGRSQLRSWLYRIATNVCLDMLQGKERRARPVDMGPAGVTDDGLGPPLPETAWVMPLPDARAKQPNADPAEVAETRDSIRLAFVAALQHLPPRQRAVLVFRDVLRWKASEVAELLDTSTASVNSALQRAHATLEGLNLGDGPEGPVDDDEQALLNRYVDAFERYDMDALTSLLRDDASWSMPPYELWLRSHDEIRRWCLGPGIGCQGSRLLPVEVNGSPGFAQYKPAAEGGFEPWSLQVVDLAGDRITGICFFLDTESLFPLFGLPDHLDADVGRREHAVQPEERQQIE